MVAFYGLKKLALVDTQDVHYANHRTDPRVTGRALGQDRTCHLEVITGKRGHLGAGRWNA
jgi:hypothetical protein